MKEFIKSIASSVSNFWKFIFGFEIDQERLREIRMHDFKLMLESKGFWFR